MLTNFVPGFLGAGGLISGKSFIAVRKQGHGTVGQADQIHQPFDPFLAADPVFLQRPEGFPFIIIPGGWSGGIRKIILKIEKQSIKNGIFKV